MNRSRVQRYKHIKKGNYENPFFPKQRRKTPPSLGRNRMMKVIAPLFLLAGLLSLQEHPYAHVRDIRIEGAHLIDEQQVREAVQSSLMGRRWAILRNNHLIFIPKKDIQNTIMSQFAVKEVVVSRQWPNALDVTIGEREPIIRLYYPPGHFSVIDSDGVAVITEVGHERTIVTRKGKDAGDTEEATDNDTSENRQISSVVECTFCDTMTDLPLVYASSTPPSSFVPGSTFISSDRASALRGLFTRFADLSIPIDYITLDESIPGTAEIRVLEGFLVYIDLSKEITPQIANLSVLLQEKYPNAPRNLQYIDVRYGNRLYYQ